MVAVHRAPSFKAGIWRDLLSLWRLSDKQPQTQVSGLCPQLPSSKHLLKPGPMKNKLILSRKKTTPQNVLPRPVRGLKRLSTFFAYRKLVAWIQFWTWFCFLRTAAKDSWAQSQELSLEYCQVCLKTQWQKWKCYVRCLVPGSGFNRWPSSVTFSSCHPASDLGRQVGSAGPGHLGAALASQC